jgi:hypothetical protein
MFEIFVLSAASITPYIAPEPLIPVYELLELMPLRVEGDRAHFESWFLLGYLRDRVVRRSLAARRWPERRECP